LRGSAGAGNQFVQKFREAGIVPNHHDSVILLVPRQHCLKLLDRGFRAQSIVNLHVALKRQFIRDKGCRLARSLQRTADDLVNLHVKVGEKPAHVARLQGAFFV